MHCFGWAGQMVHACAMHGLRAMRFVHPLPPYTAIRNGTCASEIKSYTVIRHVNHDRVLKQMAPLQLLHQIADLCANANVYHNYANANVYHNYVMRVLQEADQPGDPSPKACPEIRSVGCRQLCRHRNFWAANAVCAPTPHKNE